VYDDGIMRVQYFRKWGREFENCDTDIHDDYDINLDCPPYNTDLAHQTIILWAATATVRILPICNYEEVEIALPEYFQMQEPNFYHDRIFTIL
jgi:hypothetical protein